MLPLSHRFPSEGGPPAHPFRFSRKRSWSSRGVAGRLKRCLRSAPVRSAPGNQFSPTKRPTNPKGRAPFFCLWRERALFPPIPDQCAFEKNNVSHR